MTIIRIGMHIIRTRDEAMRGKDEGVHEVVDMDPVAQDLTWTDGEEPQTCHKCAE